MSLVGIWKKSWKWLQGFEGWLQSSQESIVQLGMRRSKTVMLAVILVTIVLGALMVRAKTDTDPVNMLPSDNSVRVLNAQMNEDFGTHDMIALGIIDENGVVNPATLTEASKVIDQIGMLSGVIPEGIISFKGAMQVPEGDLSQQDVDQIEAAVSGNPMFAGQVISPDGKALAVYIPLTKKSMADDVSSAVKALVKENRASSTQEYYVAGMPLAQETFGHDMFIQMFLLAPIAGLLLCLLLYFFFRVWSLVLAAMAVTLFTVIWTMGLLIGIGFKVSIMSSMIPVFLMPLSILSSVYIFTWFLEHHRHSRDRQTALLDAYRPLYVPTAYATLTTVVGFAFLAIAPIPPIQVFGPFVALGLLVSRLLSLLFIPAFIMLLDEEKLKQNLASKTESRGQFFNNALRGMGRIASKKHIAVVAIFIVMGVAAIPGVTSIKVNDNPVLWFKGGSDVRVSMDAMNDHFPGMYSTSVLVTSDESSDLTDPQIVNAVASLQDYWSQTGLVGASTSYADVITIQNYYSHEQDEAWMTIPDSPDEIQGLLESAASQSNMVGSLITADQTQANVQLLLKNGDNRHMQEVINVTDSYLEQNPLPAGMTMHWAGDTYLNLVWQDDMVNGMLQAFFSTIFVVLLLMIVLLRSLRWALLSMIPMALTILFIYGFVGFVGKSYDMPIAVISTLVLGIGVDFAIYFIQLYREEAQPGENARVTLKRVFEEPARGITRNALIVAIGFVPLFFSSLVPYITVAAFLVSIMLISWIVTLLLLPALITLFFGRKDVPQEVPEITVSEVSDKGPLDGTDLIDVNISAAFKQ